MDAHGNQVLHIRGDSDTQMENLFEVLKHGHSQQSSYRNKNLPKSFFEPPTRASHSREGSQDSTNFNPLAPLARIQPVSHPGILINHGRSQSSPAQLPLSLSAAPPPQSQAHHNKQNSIDFVGDNAMAQLHLPGGAHNWDGLKTGPQRYFVK